MMDELDRVCGDLRFVVTGLSRSGSAAVQADLARSAITLAGRLGRVIAQNAHLLGPVAHSAIAVKDRAPASTAHSAKPKMPASRCRIPAERPGIRDRSQHRQQPRRFPVQRMRRCRQLADSRVDQG
jgi:hypothetical protein